MIKKILILALVAVLMTACAFSLPGKFTQLADKVADKGADFTPAQWEKANAQFEVKQINALLKKVPSAIDTAAEGAKGFFEELGL